jgi:hypothetical protein
MVEDKSIDLEREDRRDHLECNLLIPSETLELGQSIQVGTAEGSVSRVHLLSQFPHDPSSARQGGAIAVLVSRNAAALC